MKYMTQYLCQIFLMACLAVSGAKANAQKSLNWRNGERYDKGTMQSIAMLPSGLVVEFHRSEQTFQNQTIWYHIGKITTGGTMKWGPSQSLDVQGNWPTVALDRDGHVILVYSVYNNKKASDLLYWVGQVKDDGDIDQKITWHLKDQFYDSGFHPSLAMRNDGYLIGVHKSGSGGTGLYYRIGHLRDPFSGKYDIVWDTGIHGKRYDDGINPHISFNSSNQVVEVHQVGGGEELLHYRRGTFAFTSISFDRSERYDNHARQPAVVLRDNGVAYELQSVGYPNTRTGILNSGDSGRIDWSDPLPIGPFTYNGYYPAIASNGKYALGVWVTTYNELYYSVALLPITREEQQ